MPVLNRDDFFNSVQTRIGTDTSEEALKFLEDMTDTFNDMENRIKSGGEDWEQKYHELDNSWRERYRHRFYDTGNTNVPSSFGGNNDPEDDYSPDDVTIDDLFS